MTERQLIRTAEAICDEIDARLASAKPRPVSRPAFLMTKGEFIAFAIVMAAGVAALIWIGRV